MIGDAMTDQLRIAEMLCTRLCHDLTGPIGAVNNGAEFLSEEGFNLQSQAVELITTSAFSAVARLQFYRAAYGRVKDHGEASLSEGQRLASDFFSGTKVTLNWAGQYTDASGVSISQRMFRLLLNFIIITANSLLKGGTVAIRIEQTPAGKLIEVKATGDAVKCDKETEEALRQLASIADLTPKNVQLYLTRSLAEELQAEIVLKASATELSLSAVQKAQGDEAAA